MIIQPFWRALSTIITTAGVVNAERHPANEIHLYRIGFAASNGSLGADQLPQMTST